MQKVFLIAWRDLAAYFNTWTGYIVAAASLFITGILFNAMAIGNEAEYSEVVLGNFFYFSSGIAMVAAICLAMRLIAEERQTGTIVLFYTSPVTERQIIYGKFLSALGFFVFLQLLSLYMPALIFIHGKVSLGHLGAGYFGILLLGAATLATTIFASTLAPNQLLAAVLGALFTVTLLVLWMLSSVVDSPFKELFEYLALHNDHFQPFRKGMVHVQHVVFYLSIVVFALECSVRALEARRWRG
jgi:ABC-2 type transport system permease protein